MSEVRIATPADRDGMISLLHMMYEEDGVAELSVRKMLEALDRGLARDKAIIGVVGEPGDIKAAIGLYANAWWYSQEVHLEDYFNFVRKDCRKSTYGKDLLSFAKKAADDLGIQLLIGILSNERSQAKVKLYERFFGPSSGAGFVYPDPNQGKRKAA